ncbi:hypothetical protein D3C83_166400 [compost metagenome]
MALVLREQGLKMFAARRPAWILVVIGQFAAGKGLVNLCIEIVTVCQDEKSEVAAELAVHLARKARHRV